MRLFLFSDLHNDEATARRLAGEALGANVAAVVSAGDLATDGVHSPGVYAPFGRVGVPVLSVPGNHDGLLPYQAALDTAGWEDLHGRVRSLDGWVLAGHGLPELDGRFSGPDGDAQADDPELTALLAQLQPVPPNRLILVTHLPPWGTLAARDRRFIDRGSVQLRRWVEAHQPAAVLCGHVHLKEAVVDQVGDTLVVNAGPHGWVGSFKVG